MTRLSDDAIGRLQDLAGRPDLPPDRYELRSLIGRGGMGSVYLAFDRLLQREVALKVSGASVAGAGLDARLQLESRVLARLEHPGIVPVHDAGVLPDGRWFYVMKLVRGRTLARDVTNTRTESAALAIFERVVEAVAFAHASGIIHRDVKPSNIMVGNFGEVLVLDWGVARILSTIAPAGAEGTTSADWDATSAGTRIGTPGFMAPEQQRGDAAAAGPAADVYSLGALLVWLLTGDSPATDGPASHRDVAARLAAHPRRLRAIVLRCLAPNPADRYEDAAALGREVQRYRAGLAVLAHPESAWERTGRWVHRYRSVILLIAAYLIMRAAFAWAQRG
jgi:serine/threonine protein kinase